MARLALLVAGLVVSAGCASEPRGTSDRSADGAPRSAARRSLLLDPEASTWKQPSPDRYLARFETTKGVFVLELVRAWAPVGVDRLYHLVGSGFFDDSRLFRIRAGYIAQFGIAGDPEISAVWGARTMADDPVIARNLYGAVGYAMTGPDTRTTQLYINLVDNTHLDQDGFAPIGRVIEGMDVVESFYSEYGEEAGGGMRRGKQGRMLTEGNAHLDADYPELDAILRARIEDAR